MDTLLLKKEFKMFFGNFTITNIVLNILLCIIKVTHTGAGILPYAFDKQSNTYYFLLGKEAYGKHAKNTWADFGGRIDLVDKGSFEQNAIREFCEESGHTLKSKSWLLKQIKQHPKIKHPYYNYHMYIAEIRYRPAKTFKGDGEKSEYSWIPVNNIIQFWGRELHKTGTIPNGFVYNNKTYMLRMAFKECITELLKAYNPDNEYRYFRSKRPKKILEQITNTP